MAGDAGLHYGADVALPADVTQVTVAIGKPTIPSMGGGRTPSATSVTFEWSQ